MDENTANNSFPDSFVAPEDDLPELVVLQRADDFYYPYSRLSIFSSLFISSLFFLVFLILFIAAIIQCKRSTRIPHEEFALIPSGPVPGYMTIVHTYPNGSEATATFQLYPKNGRTSTYYSECALYHAGDAPPSYQSMARDPDLPAGQPVPLSSNGPSTTASHPNPISPTPEPRRFENTSNPFLDHSNSDASRVDADIQSEVTTSTNPFLNKNHERPSVLSESESLTDDDVFYEVDTCPPPEGQSLQNENEHGKKHQGREAER